MPELEKKLNIANYAVSLAVALGVDTAFSLTGGMAMFINQAIGKNKKLKKIYCQHEQVCVAAAEGYSKSKDFRIPGLAVVTAGPGVSNAVTSIIAAYGDSVPMIILAGQIKSTDIDVYGLRTHGIQEIKSSELLSPCVKVFVRLDDKNYRANIIEAYEKCMSGRPGPVFIEIPLDIQSIVTPYSIADVDSDALEISRRIEKNKNDEDFSRKIAACLDNFLTAERPLIYIGNGCRIAGVEDGIKKFINKYKIPAVFSWLSFDILPSEHELCFGCPGGLAPIYSNRILGCADKILFLGARLDLGTTAFQRSDFGSQAERFIIDIDDAELKKFNGLSNLHQVKADLNGFNAATSLISENHTPRLEWLKWCKICRSNYLEEELIRLSSNKMNVYNITQTLSNWSENKVFVSASSGYAEETFTRFLKPKNNTRFFNSAALGAMGMGLGNAIGAAFATEKQVICLEADGGIMLNIQELATLKNCAPRGFVLFVFNNNGYESIRSSQMRFFNEVFGADQGSGVNIPDFRHIAAAFELPYFRIENIEELENFLSTSSLSDPPMFVDLIIDKFEYRGPAVKTQFDSNGRPYSTPISDISW